MRAALTLEQAYERVRERIEPESGAPHMLLESEDSAPISVSEERQSARWEREGG